MSQIHVGSPNVYPETPWAIYRGHHLCARVKDHQSALKAKRQLAKIPLPGELRIEYQGKDIRHCDVGGTAIK